MKKFFFSLILMTGLGLVMTSCNKDDDPDPASTFDLLTDKCWKLENAPDPCDADDTQYFNADGSYLLDVGSNLCDPEDEDSMGTWELSSDNTTLSITAEDGGFSVTIDFVIESISENSLTLSLAPFGSVTYIKC